MNRNLIFAAAFAVLAVGCKSGDTETAAAPTPPPAKATEATPPPVTASATPASAEYTAVQAVFTKSCVNCHGAGRAKAGVHLTDHDSVMKGGRGGPIVVAGDPDASLLIKSVRRQPGAKPMPPGAPLPDNDIKVIADWIKNGAKA